MKNKKSYNLTEEKTTELHYLKKEKPINTFRMNGIAIIKLWGGGSGSIEMDTVEFKANNLKKTVIYDNLNDGQFGSEHIISARVYIEQLIKVEKIPLDKNGIKIQEVNSKLSNYWKTIVEDLYISRKNDFV